VDTTSTTIELPSSGTGRRQTARRCLSPNVAGSPVDLVLQAYRYRPPASIGIIADPAPRPDSEDFDLPPPG
jgi:hypothetical protein